jgi:hypothetical protein
MTTPAESGIQTVYKPWWDAASMLLSYQWKLFAFQYQVGLKFMEAALGGRADRDPDAPTRGIPTPPQPGIPIPSDKPAIASEAKKLERLAVERVSQGLSPPREVYQVPFRSQIDWTRFPDWARPSDPELFEGAVHEG